MFITLYYCLIHGTDGSNALLAYCLAWNVVTSGGKLPASPALCDVILDLIPGLTIAE